MYLEVYIIVLQYYLSKEWNVKVNSSKKNIITAQNHQTFELEESKSLYLSSPIQQFHIFTEDDHIKCDKNEDKFIDMVELPEIYQNESQYMLKNQNSFIVNHLRYYLYFTGERIQAVPMIFIF